MPAAFICHSSCPDLPVFLSPLHCLWHELADIRLKPLKYTDKNLAALVRSAWCKTTIPTRPIITVSGRGPLEHTFIRLFVREVPWFPLPWSQFHGHVACCQPLTFGPCLRRYSLCGIVPTWHNALNLAGAAPILQFLWDGGAIAFSSPSICHGCVSRIFVGSFHLFPVFASCPSPPLVGLLLFSPSPFSVCVVPFGLLFPLLATPFNCAPRIRLHAIN